MDAPRSSPGELTLTVIAPSRNEQDSVGPLAEAVRAALPDVAYELLIVDDSDDATPQVVASMEADPTFHVRLLHRPKGPARWGGLSGAVVDGLRTSNASYVCIIDADLQHPPDKIAELLAAAQLSGCDVAMACRYIPGGSSEGLAGPARTAFSLGCKWLCKLAFPVRLRGVHDPLSGFLLVRRSITEDVYLRPLGFKISLELLVRCKRNGLVEIPYRFRRRVAGTSKADFRVGQLFLHHLWRLRTS